MAGIWAHAMLQCIWLSMHAGMSLAQGNVAVSALIGLVRYLVLLCKLEREVLTCLLVSDLIDDQVSCVQVNLCGLAFFDGDTQLQVKPRCLH